MEFLSQLLNKIDKIYSPDHFYIYKVFYVEIFFNKNDLIVIILGINTIKVNSNFTVFYSYIYLFILKK